MEQVDPVVTLRVVVVILVLVLVGLLMLSLFKTPTRQVVVHKKSVKQTLSPKKPQIQPLVLVGSSSSTLDTCAQFGIKYRRCVDKDPLVEPTRRITPVSSNIPRLLIQGPPPPVRVRGTPDPFAYIGNLHRENDNKVMRLYGRRRYPEVWDYYAMFNSKEGTKTKINVITKGNKEIMDGDAVVVDMFKRDGPFKTFLHKVDQYDYMPYLI
jgi:hypothetical protein